MTRGIYDTSYWIVQWGGGAKRFSRYGDAAGFALQVAQWGYGPVELF